MNLLRLPSKDELIFPQEVAPYIVFSFALSVFFFLGGLYMAVSDPSVIINQISNLKSMVEGVADLTLVGLLFIIFFNNCLVALLASLGGLLFSILPLIIILTNGFFVGIVFYFVLDTVSWNFFIAGILPHGLVELPVIFFSTAMGLWLGRCFFKYLFLKTETKVSLFLKIKKVFYTYVFVVVPLLFLAAVIESFLTPYVLKLFFDVDLLL